MLHIDIETYCEIDLPTVGLYKYAAHPSFRVMLFAYAFGDDPPAVVDVEAGEEIPSRVLQHMANGGECAAHNAAFERICLRSFGIPTAISQWRCTAVMARLNGCPGSLEGAGKALGLPQDKAKSADGKKLIRMFSVLQRSAKKGPYRVLPSDRPTEWESFKTYCAQDVVAEQEIYRLLKQEYASVFEDSVYRLDQQINDRGVRIDNTLACAAVMLWSRYKEGIVRELQALTGLDNPNSTAQCKAWLESETGTTLPGIGKDVLAGLELNGEAAQFIEMRKLLAKSSLAKYSTALDMLDGGRVRGMFQYYGATTGRWAGRGIQLQNLPRNSYKDIPALIEAAKNGDVFTLEALMGSVPAALAETLRAMIIPPSGKSLVVCDFSSIEARVLSWLSGEEWRMEVFRGDGKIYEASAAAMFNVPVEQVTKGSELRALGKIAELALGYQGGVGALFAMGGEAMGISTAKADQIVKKWRAANPRIASTWYAVEGAAKKAILSPGRVVTECGGKLAFCLTSKGCLHLRLPSGRVLVYRDASVRAGKIIFKSANGTAQMWGLSDTYGGKLVENVTQAIARDLLAHAMLRWKLEKPDAPIVLHVHDEIGVEVADDQAEATLERMEAIMSEPPDWASDLPLAADGYVSKFYKK